MYFNLKMEYNHNECHCNCKKYHMCKKDYNWNPSTCICENSRYLKSIVDTLVIVCDEIINSMDSVSTNVTKTIPTNAMSTASIYSDDKKVTCEKSNCLLHNNSSVPECLLLLVVISISYYYHCTRHWVKKEYTLPH